MQKGSSSSCLKIGPKIPPERQILAASPVKREDGLKLWLDFKILSPHNWA
jgi:hypothetical protein